VEEEDAEAEKGGNVPHISSFFCLYHMFGFKNAGGVDK